MPFSIIRDDITRVHADAIVNTANPHPLVGSGTDQAIYEAAGKEELLREREKIGDIPRGKAAVTSAFRLPAKYIIHTVGPVYTDGMHGEEETLRSCYRESLNLASTLKCESIAFPLISSGAYGFPKDAAIKAASETIHDFLMNHEMQVYLVVFDAKAFALSSDAFEDVRSYIDDHYVMEKKAMEYARPSMARRREAELFTVGSALKADTCASMEEDVSCNSISIEDALEHTEESFQDFLLQMIIDRDLKNTDVYNGANITKQTFSKIMSNADYTPKKNTICALAISLKLNLEETNELLEKAGMVLSHSSRFDIAIEYFINHQMYNVIEDNVILFQNGLKLLGQQ